MLGAVANDKLAEFVTLPHWPFTTTV